MQVTDVKVYPAEYHCAQGFCRGTNVTFKVDGRCMSSRLNWIETKDGAEKRIREQIKKGIIK